MINKNIFFSFLLCVYKEEERFIIRCLESIINQSFKDFELIIVVDNPQFYFSENSKKLLSQLKFKKIIYNNENIGLTKSLNKGLRHTKGQFIVRQDADDFSNKNRLKRAYDLINLKRFKIYTTPAKVEGKTYPHIIIRKLYSNKLLRFKNIFFHGSLIIESKLLKKYLYNEHFTYSQDFELYNRLLDNGETIYYDKYWVSYNQIPNKNNISSRNPKRQKYFFRKILKRNGYLFIESKYSKSIRLDYILTVFYFIRYKIFRY